jgi:hypothetical protein
MHKDSCTKGMGFFCFTLLQPESYFPIELRCYENINFHFFLI